MSSSSGTSKFENVPPPSYEKTQPSSPEDDSQSTTTQVVRKVAKRRILISSLLMLFGLFVAYLAAYFAPLNPTPFTSKLVLANPSNWIQAIEKNGIYRVSLVNTVSPIKEYGISANQLALIFEDEGSVLISPEGRLASLPENNEDQAIVVQNIAFEPDNVLLTDEEKQKIDALFESINYQNETIEIELTGYIGSTNTPQTEQVSQQLQQPQQLKNPAANQQVAQSSYTNSSSAQVAKTSPTDIPSEYALALGERLTLSVQRYIQTKFDIDNIILSSSGNQRHYDNGWKSGIGAKSGVHMKVAYRMQSINWRPIPINQTSIAIPVDDDLPAEQWEILNENVFNFIDSNGNVKTIAALLPAFIIADPDIFAAIDNGDSLPSNIKLPTSQLYPSILSIVLLLIFGFASLRSLKGASADNNSTVVTDQKIVDNFISDAPASDKSQDKLGFLEVSQALSSFLRNRGTKAPLTLAITGVWGSGKSSLMYFLKQNLESYRLRPVWINAWHHQNEEQFLAGLLNSVRTNAIPSFLSSAGLLYRWNLFKMRWGKSPVFYTFASLFFFGSLSYLITSQNFSLERMSASEGSNLQSYTAIITTILGAIPLILASMDKVSSLVSSSNPLRMLLGSPGRALDLRSNVGLRQKFAKEFNLLCKALGDSTLTIFIDDLDRCKESRIMDVMETLNYLVSSGDCYIVLGMEREPVEKAIVNYYRDTHQDLSNDAIQTKARRYLEKIINIEIPVPAANSQQVSSLISVTDQAEPDKTKNWEWLGPLLFIFALSASIIFGATLSGSLSLSKGSDADTPITTELNQSQDQTGQSAGDSSDSSTSPLETLPTKTVLLTVPSSEPERNYIWFVIPLLLAGITAITIRVEKYKQRKQIVEEDSAPFVSAISVWAQALGSTNHTPRSIKRYVNRARYLAMRNLASGADIKEENLVTLAALLEFADQNELDNLDALKQHIPDFKHQSFENDINALLDKSTQITDERKATFMHWVKGVRVNIG